MLKLKLLTALFLTFSLASFSQTPALSGTIKDGETKQPLTGATVKIVSGKDSSSVLSDKSGGFEFKYINPGKYNMVISYLGYEVITSIKTFDLYKTKGLFNLIVILI